jgi:isopropylmalate/homocitrate/citramalate synthase
MAKKSRLKLSKKTYVLEQDYYHYELRDVKEPNLHRTIFSYQDIPKVPFNHRHVPIAMPNEIWITDTTFRDGQQARPPYTVEQIIQLYKFLHRLGGAKGKIKQTEFFLYSEKDREAVRKCQELGYKFPEITGWIRANRKDLEIVKEMGLKETGILTSCSDYHIFLKLHKTRKQALEGYLNVVKAALDLGIVPRCHFEDATRADFLEFVIPFAQELMKLSKQYDMPVKIRLCDTMGYGVPYDGASTPRGIQQIIYNMLYYGGVPSEYLEWHGHNDFHKVLINASTAWLYGCSAANGTLLGIGERTGNPPIEALVIEYAALRGELDGMHTPIISEIAHYYRSELGYHIPSNFPFVGTDFNTTRAGIHADGVLKNEEIYSIFNTEKFLHQPLVVAINDKSGLAGVAYWVNSMLDLKDDKRLDKKDEGVQKMYEWVMEQYTNGRTTEISSEEMLHAAQQIMPKKFRKF